MRMRCLRKNEKHKGCILARSLSKTLKGCGVNYQTWYYRSIKSKVQDRRETVNRTVNGSGSQVPTLTCDAGTSTRWCIRGIAKESTIFILCLPWILIEEIFFSRKTCYDSVLSFPCSRPLLLHEPNITLTFDEIRKKQTIFIRNGWRVSV